MPPGHVATTPGAIALTSPTATATSHHLAAVLERMRHVHLEMLDAVLAGEGLSKVAQLAASAAGGPVAVVIPTSIVTLARDERQPSSGLSALVRWVTERVGGRPAAVPADVLADVPISLRDEVVGFVALLGSDEAPSAEAVQFLHLAASAALLELAVENAKLEAEERLRGLFFEELRSRQGLSGAEVVRRAAGLGCDLTGGAVILCVEVKSERPRLVATTITEEYPGALAQQLDGPGDRGIARVYAALPAGRPRSDPMDTLAAANRLAARLHRHGTVGLSTFHADPAELHEAVLEAELVVEVLRQSGAQITDEMASGTYKLLFRMMASHPEEVQSFYDATIAPMVRYDDQYGTELMRTLQAYLDANCNMNVTASGIYAHRHTVAQRLERVRILTGLDPMRSDDRERLGLGLKVHRITAPRQPR
jgi:sugar diacid utilization regulator